MVRHIGDKLREERGATLLMALFALLIASLVCIVILGASVTTVKQAKSTQQQEQDTLLLQSAAKLVADDFRDVVVKKTVHVTVTKGDNSLSSEYGTPSFTAEKCMINNAFAATARTAIESGSNPESAPSSGTFTVSANLPNGYDNGLDLKNTVKVDYIIRNESYTGTDQVGMNRQVIFTFKLMANDTPSKVSQQMFLKMAFDQEKTNNENVSLHSDGVGSYDIVTRHTWKKPEFYTGEGAN